jgi:hypothetical protein
VLDDDRETKHPTREDRACSATDQILNAYFMRKPHSCLSCASFAPLIQMPAPYTLSLRLLRRNSSISEYHTVPTPMPNINKELDSASPHHTAFSHDDQRRECRDAGFRWPTGSQATPPRQACQSLGARPRPSMAGLRFSGSP